MAFTWHSQCPLKPGTGFCIHGPNLILNRSLWNPCAVGRENETVENKQGLAWALLIFGAAFYLKVSINYSGAITECYNLEETVHTYSTACQKTSCLLFSCPCYPVPAPATAHITKIQHNHSYWLVTYVKTPATLTSRKWHICNTYRVTSNTMQRSSQLLPLGQHTQYLIYHIGFLTLGYHVPCCTLFKPWVSN